VEFFLEEKNEADEFFPEFGISFTSVIFDREQGFEVAGVK